MEIQKGIENIWMENVGMGKIICNMREDRVTYLFFYLLRTMYREHVIGSRMMGMGGMDAKRIT